VEKVETIIPWRRAKRPFARVAGPYGRPAHPAVVVVPLGAWTSSLVFDVGSRAGGPPDALATGASWLIGVGLSGALPALSLGFLDLIQVPAGTRTMRLGLTHMALNVTATTLYLGDFLLRRHRRPDGQGVPASLIGLSGTAYGLLAVAGHLGGKLAYRYGVRVADESDQRDGYGAAGGTA
jgi:uncharacterized membrane protein